MMERTNWGALKIRTIPYDHGMPRLKNQERVWAYTTLSWKILSWPLWADEIQSVTTLHRT